MVIKSSAEWKHCQIFRITSIFDFKKVNWNHVKCTSEAINCVGICFNAAAESATKSFATIIYNKLFLPLYQNVCEDADAAGWINRYEKWDCNDVSRVLQNNIHCFLLAAIINHLCCSKKASLRDKGSYFWVLSLSIDEWTV